MAKERVERDEEDLVRLYLTDIGQYPLLTKEDEVRLAQAIEAGAEARTEFESIDTELTPAKKRELRRAMQKGEQAERTFVQSNLRLVVSSRPGGAIWMGGRQVAEEAHQRDGLTATAQSCKVDSRVQRHRSEDRVDEGEGVVEEAFEDSLVGKQKRGRGDMKWMKVVADMGGRVRGYVALGWLG